MSSSLTMESATELRVGLPIDGQLECVLGVMRPVEGASRAASSKC